MSQVSNTNSPEIEDRFKGLNPQGAFKGLSKSEETKALEPEPFSFKWYIDFYILNWFLSAQIIASSVLVQVFTFSLPLFYMVIFDRVFGRQNLAALNVMACGMGLMLLFDFLVKSFRAYILCYQTELADKLSIENLLNRIFHMPLSGTNAETKKLFASQFSDLIKVNRTFGTSLLISWVEIVFSILVLIFIASIDLQLGLIASAPLIPISAIIFFSSRSIQAEAIAFEKEQKECQMKLTELVEGMESIRSSNSEKYLKFGLIKKIEQTLHDGFQSRFDSSNGGNLINLIGTVGSIALLYFGAQKVLQGDVTSGVYISINMLSRTLIASFQRLFYSVISFEEAYGTLSQIREITGKPIEDHKEKVKVSKSQIKGELLVDKVFFKYQPDLAWSLKDVSLKISPGEKIVFTGRSGSGKSTLGRLMQGLYDPSSGSILLDGYHILDFHPDSLRSFIGLVQQKPSIFSGSIKDNIVMGNYDASEKEISDAIRIVGLEPMIRKLPNGLDSEVSILGSNIALDQAARIALARILLVDPKVLILDDSIPYLDIISQNDIYDHIFEAYKDKTCIFITNYLPVHKKADRVYVMNEGQIIEAGTYQELMNKEGVYSRAYQLKAKN